MSTPKRILFAGTPEFAAQHLGALVEAGHDICAVLTQPDRPAGRGKRLQPSAVKTVALAAGLDVLQPPSLRQAEIQTQLAALNADVMVVVAYGLLLPRAVLDTPRFGCLNVHASLLPRWRGAAPIQRAIEAGDTESGVTIMLMEAGLDTGPMLRRVGVPLAPMETGQSLHDRLAEVGPEALLSVLSDLPAHLAAQERQDDALATYAAKISKTECALDWQRDAPALCRQIRAFNPAPVCYSYLGSDRIKVWEAEEQTLPEDDTPGKILDATPSGVLIACGSGALRVTRLQFPGARALPAAELLHGRGSELVAGRQFTPTEADQ